MVKVVTDPKVNPTILVFRTTHHSKGIYRKKMAINLRHGDGACT